MNKIVQEANLTKNSQEKLSMLNGCEVYSVWNYEGTVSVKGADVYYGGEKIDTLNTNDKVQKLWDEYFENEFGGTELYV